MKLLLNIILALQALIYTLSLYLFITDEMTLTPFILLSLAFFSYIIFYGINLKRLSK